jgi:hypothetical protein
MLPFGSDWSERRIVESGLLPPMWVNVLIEILKHRLAEYATSLHEDREILRDLQQQLAANPLPPGRKAEGPAKDALEERLEAHFSLKRKIMALEVRIGEKEILQEAINWLQEFSEVAEAEKPRKRQRIS